MTFPPEASVGQEALTFEREQAPAEHPQQQPPATARELSQHENTKNSGAPHLLERQHVPGTSSPHPTTHHMSRFPTSPVKMPSRASGQAQEGNSPHAARRGWYGVSTAPSAALLLRLPAGPPLTGPAERT